MSSDTAIDAVRRETAWFELVAAEADWPDAYRVNRRVRRASDDLSADAGGGVGRRAHLFEEPGTLEQLAKLAAEWCRRHLAGAGA